MCSKYSKIVYRKLFTAEVLKISFLRPKGKLPKITENNNSYKVENIILPNLFQNRFSNLHPIESV